MDAEPKQLKPFRILLAAICIFVILWTIVRIASFPGATAADRQPDEVIDIASALSGKLVMRAADDQFSDVPSDAMASTDYYMLYFSAGWCGPCHQVTPGLVEWYIHTKPMMPNIELILCSFDKDEEAMQAYANKYQIPFPVLPPKVLDKLPQIERYAGDGIPCLVVVDRDGKIVADSYNDKGYVGPSLAVDQVNKMVADQLNLAQN